MVLFVCGIAFLVAGYFTYGRVIERLLGPDERATPALTQRDGVDYLPLPMWKNTLIQLAFLQRRLQIDQKTAAFSLQMTAGR